jgi:methyl-accepting chemotaxis protein
MIARRITLPLRQTTSILRDLDKGIIDPSKKVRAQSNDELAEMAKSLNNLLDTLSKTTEFAKKIGEGDFNAQYTALSKFDVLGNTLIEMQKNLKVGQEQEEIRQLERAKLNWAQDGLSQLGEVLRTSTDNFEDYLFVILGHIVNYLKADQGGIFILNTLDSEHPYLELLAAYAYNKKKSLQAKIEIGESLVGRCFQEKEVIYMTNLPDGYTFVSSGLGSHEPNCLFLMPLVYEDEPFGVIELASFRELADFEIEFLKSIGERVASSTSIMQKNVHTKQLLDQYQIRSEELTRREQILQETLSELQKSQEDGIIKEKENEGIIESLLKIGSVTWYNMGGTIINIKDPNLANYGLSEKDMKGKKHLELETDAKADMSEYVKFWNDLKNGESRQRTIRKKTLKDEIWLSETYTPIKDKTGNPYKIICIAIDITAQKKLNDEIEKLQFEIINLKKL